MNGKKCVFAGTFDPPTLGHKFVIDACLPVFDEVIVALMVNPDKAPLFSLEERGEMLRSMYPSSEGSSGEDSSGGKVKILSFSGTVAELMEREQANVYVRGIRGGADAEYENFNFYSSRKLNGELTAFYVPCPQELLHVSSTMVRSCLKFSAPLSGYVTKETEEYIQKILKERSGKA